MEKFIVESNVSEILCIKSLKITFKKRGEIVDLCSRSGQSVYDLKKNNEINIFIETNRLKVIQIEERQIVNQIVKEIVSVDNSEMSSKMDKLLSVFSPENLKEMLKEIVDKKIEVHGGVSEKTRENIEDDTEGIREELMKTFVFNKDKKVEGNIENFGKNTQKIDASESKNLDDLIDF